MQHVTAAPSLPPALDELLLRCLEKDPARRPGAYELRRSLLALPLTQPWTKERAAAWWREHGAANNLAIDVDVGASTIAVVDPAPLKTTLPKGSQHRERTPRPVRAMTKIRA
jgi:serine/threonine protein kinase